MKTFFLILIVGFVLAGLAFFTFNKERVTHVAGLFERPSSIVDVPSLFATVYSFSNDADVDGLSDAKEIIYGSDPNLADTDGDGFYDGEEVKAGFDPLMAGTGTGRLSERKDLSLTIAYFIWAQEKTGNPDPALESALIEEFLTQKGLLHFSLPQITDFELKFTNDEPQKIRDYLEFSASLSLPEKGSPFLALAQQVVQSQENQVLQEVQSDITNTLQNLKEERVPASLKELHRGYVAIWQSLEEIFSSLSLAKRDPVGIFLASEKGKWLVTKVGETENLRAKLISEFRLRLLEES